MASRTETKIETWRKLEGGDMILARRDGGVEFAGFGERRVLAEAEQPVGRVRLTATAVGGPAYEVYAHAGLGPSGRLSGYVVTLDALHRGGSVVVRLLGEGALLAAPIAEAPFPAGFVLERVKHSIEVEAGEDSIAVAIDGTQLLAIADLGLVTAEAILLAAARPSAYLLSGEHGFGIGVPSFTQLRVHGAWISAPVSPPDRR